MTTATPIELAARLADAKRRNITSTLVADGIAEIIAAKRRGLRFYASTLARHIFDDLLGMRPPGRAQRPLPSLDQLRRDLRLQKQIEAAQADVASATLAHIDSPTTQMRWALECANHQLCSVERLMRPWAAPGLDG